MLQLIQHFYLWVSTEQQIMKHNYGYRTSEHLENSDNSVETNNLELDLALGWITYGFNCYIAILSTHEKSLMSRILVGMPNLRRVWKWL